jgi:hypothetical protein
LHFLTWYITPLYTATFIALLLSTTTQGQRIERRAFKVLSVLWAMAALFRPWGVTPDDVNYEIHFFMTDPFSVNGFENVMGFSYLYYLTLSLVREIVDTYFAFLIISSVFVLLKLTLIARVTNYSLASLFIYVSVFFMLHDVVQFRVAVAAFFYLLAVYLFMERRRVKSVVSYVISVFVHSQAAVAPLSVLCSKVLKNRYWLAIGLVVLTQGLTTLNWTPPLQGLLDIFVLEDAARLSNAVEQEEGSSGFRLTSVAILIFLAIAVKPLRHFDEEQPLYRYAFYSAIAGFLLFWIVASSGTLSSRLMIFMWIPIVFLGPLMKKSHLFYFGGIVICIAFFILNGWFNGLVSVE